MPRSEIVTMTTSLLSHASHLKASDSAISPNNCQNVISDQLKNRPSEGGFWIRCQCPVDQFCILRRFNGPALSIVYDGPRERRAKLKKSHHRGKTGYPFSNLFNMMGPISVLNLDHRSHHFICSYSVACALNAKEQTEVCKRAPSANLRDRFEQAITWNSGSLCNAAL